MLVWCHNKKPKVKEIAKGQFSNQAGTVYRRQILTSKDNPSTEKISKNIMAVDSSHRYSNEAERANWDIYDEFKLKKTFWFPWFTQNYLIFVRVNGRWYCGGSVIIICSRLSGRHEHGCSPRRQCGDLSTANTRRSPNAGLMLGQRRRRWPNIKPALGERL